MEKHNYFPAKLVHSEHLLEFTNLKDFNRFLTIHKLSTVFLLDEKEGIASHFAVSYKGGLLRQSTEGFKSLEDYSEATREQFPDSASFYAAQQMGYKTYADYKLVSEAGISNADEFNAMKEKGFARGFAALKEAANGNGLAFANGFELYKHATEKGFADFAEYEKATESGFADGNIYKAAVAKGFENAADYDEALAGGYISSSELKLARKFHIRDRADFMRFTDLELAKKSGAQHDQRVMINMLSKLPEGKKVSINKLQELLAKAMDEYKYPDTEKMPQWFTIGFSGKESMVNFLINNDAVKKYGSYDTDGEFFETKTIQSRKVVIDGSNVAHNSHGNQHSKPYAANIINMVHELKRRGFNDIAVIADASLRHRLEDKNKLNELKKITEYMEAPAETPADIFILQYVKQEHCLLVSNDLFREWKLTDPWVALNLDYYRIAFMIKENTVLLPDLDKK